MVWWKVKRCEVVPIIFYFRTFSYVKPYVAKDANNFFLYKSNRM